MDRRMSAALDRYITGNFGEDQFKDIPPSCEDCKVEEGKCPGEDKCIEVILDGRPACCIKHKVEMLGGECGGCEAEAFAGGYEE